jgi:outer membrane cobalamin receptor
MNNWKPRNDLFASFGIEYKDENGKNNSIIADFLPADFDLSRSTLAFSGEFLYSKNSFNANLGLRIDNPEDFDTEVSPRVGANYLFENSKTRIRGSWGEGFKLPSFYALGEPNVGNPNLRPETSNGFDLGVDQDLFDGHLQLALTYFWNRYKDLIDFSAEQFLLVNRDLVKDQGFEFEGTVPVSKAFRFNGYVGYTDAKIEDSPERLRDRPRWRGGIGFDWYPLEGSHLRVDTVWVGERPDFQLPVPQFEFAEAYSTTNLVFNQQVGRDFSAYVRIENLFNNKYQNFIGFPDPGLFARVGLLYKFGG